MYKEIKIYRQGDKAMAEIKSGMSYASDNNVGNIQISEEAVSVIAGIAATEVEEVVSLVGNITNELVSKMGITKLSKGIKVRMEEDTVSVTVTFNLTYGCVMLDVCRTIQEKIAQAIETMTNLSVAEVNVYVNDIIIKK